MISRTTLLVIMVFLSSRLYSQTNIEALSKTKPLECSDIAYANSTLFAQLIQRHQNDSAQQLLNYWEGKCGEREPVFRAKVVMSFVRKQSVEPLMNNESLYELNNYRSRAEMLKWRRFSFYDYDKSYYGFVPVGQEFDSFTIDFFKAAKLQQELGTINYLLSEFYGYNADTLYTMIQTKAYDSTSLSKQYYSLVKKYSNKFETNIAMLMGMWIPTGGIAHLGIHPDMGFQIGIKKSKINVDVTVTFKFLKSKTMYAAKRVHSDQSIVLTEKFFGGYIGLDAGYDVWYKKRNEIQALAGIGWDGFDALNVVDAKKAQS